MKFFGALFMAIILIGVWNVLELNAAKSSETKSSTKPSASKASASKAAASKASASKASATKFSASKASATKSSETKSSAPRTSVTKTSATKTSATKTSATKTATPENPISSQQLSTIAPDEIKPVDVLSGHKGGFFSGPNGTFLKLVGNKDVPEVIAYQKMQKDPDLLPIIPKYYGVIESNGKTYLVLQNVSQGFEDSSELDIKLGHRTFSEEDALIEGYSTDLYNKISAFAPEELTEEEHNRTSISKLRSRLIRDKLSGSLSYGFRITALRIKGAPPMKDFMNSTHEQVRDAIASFLYGSKHITEEVLKRLKQIRTCIAKSRHYKHREVTGSSIFLVRDETHVGGWLLDFNKTIEVPETITVNHLSPWKQGNYEDGVLFGIDNLIQVVSDIGRSTIAPGIIKPAEVLGGHKGGFFSGPNGTFLKLVGNKDVPEVIAYQKMQKDPDLLPIIPKYHGVLESNGKTYLVLQNVSQGFEDPSELDIKLGHRTFSEEDALIEDYSTDKYEKAKTFAPEELTEEEHNRKSISKLRSRLIRDKLSGSLSNGFRITALRIKGAPPMKDFMNPTQEQVRDAIASFLYGSKRITEELLKRLKQIRTCIAKSRHYKHREVTGSSVFLVRDETHVGGWLLDFNKTIELPETITVNHLSPWKQGNYEDGVLFGIDNLIKLVSDIGSRSARGSKKSR